MLGLPLLVPAIRLDRGDAEAESRRALARADQPWCAGFLLFGGEAEGVARLTRALRERAGRDLLVASDMERGAGQQVEGLTVLPEAAVLGLGGSPDDAEAFGRITAAEARSVGVDVVFAPVLDVPSDGRNPIVGHRAFSWDPARVAALGRAFVRGVEGAGARAVAKHYPGHGATTADSHVARPVVDAPRDVLETRDLQPFHAVLEDGRLGAVMTAHVAYPALDGTGVVATESAAILGALRERVRPREVVAITDALTMAGALGPDGASGAARRALAAGADLLLYPEDPEAVAHALDDGLGEAAAGRVERWLAGRGGGPGTLAPAEATAACVAAVAEGAVARAFEGGPARGEVLILDDDGAGPRGAAIEAAARARGLPGHRIDLTTGPCPAASRLAAAGLVVLFASVRMAKGPAGLGPGARAVLDRLPPGVRLVALGAWTPRADLHLPGTHPAVEAALARRLFETIP